MVDNHLVHLHGEESMKKFNEVLTYSKKLRYLSLQQANFDKNERVRMIDITQSYNVLDSA